MHVASVPFARSHLRRVPVCARVVCAETLKGNHPRKVARKTPEPALAQLTGYRNGKPHHESTVVPGGEGTGRPGQRQQEPGPQRTQQVTTR